MHERIKELRKNLGLNQMEFGKRIGVAPNTISTYENRTRALSDAIIMLICREFGVNETWLRFGTGDMHQTKSREQELGELIRSRLVNRSDSFQAALVTTLLRFDPDGPQMQALEQILQNLIDGTKKDPEP